MQEDKFGDVVFDQTRESDNSGLPIAQLGASFGYWLLAHSYFLPGLYLQRYSTLFGLSLATKRRTRLPKRLVYRLLNGTLESTRYFEFDFAWKALPLDAKGRDYLDVLSPWLLPLLLLQRQKILTATVANDDPSALPEFRRLLAATELGTRCNILDMPLSGCPIPAESFDVITSIAGLARVENDSVLAARMWTLLRPGGRLILSLPCTSSLPDSADVDGHHHLSDGLVASTRRLYDPELLRERIYSILGEPQTTVVYGEIVKRDCNKQEATGLTSNYISPREPIDMARDWRCFSRIEDLPGVGVIAMTFSKS
jgi:SAM-dependent methyltransferase